MLCHLLNNFVRDCCDICTGKSTICYMDRISDRSSDDFCLISVNIKIKFTDIPKIIEKTIEKEFAKGNSFEEVFYTDSEARKFASALVR